MTSGSINLETLLVAVSASTSLVVLVVALLAWFQFRRQQRYDFERHRVELDLMRQSVEKDIYRRNMQLVATPEGWSDLNHLVRSQILAQLERLDAKKIPDNLPVFQMHGIDATKLSVNRKLVFVLTPFNDQFDQPYEAVRAACDDLGLTCVRGDEQLIEGDLLPHIIRTMATARTVIANIDGRNPNVFYELGLAHSMGKPTIIMTSSISEVPFDLRSKKLVAWKDPTELRDKIRNELSKSFVQE